MGARLGRLRAIAGILAVTAGAVVGVVALPAGAGVGLGVTIGFPSAATVGQTGLTGSLGVTNTSDGQQSGGTVSLTSLSLVPSCATAAPACGDGGDPGVFGVGARAQGGAGTACSGRTFSAAVVDGATGRVAFTPEDGLPVTLGPPGSAAATCRVDFPVRVVAAPSRDASGSVPGLQTNQAAAATGVHADGTTGSGYGSHLSTVGTTRQVEAPAGSGVAAATPMITITASGTVPVGGQIFANANLLGAVSPSGTITFRLFGPADPVCAGPALFTVVVPVTGTSVNSPPFTTAQAGTYRWTAVYSGDVNNTAAGPTSCTDPSAAVVVTRAATVLNTTAAPLSGGQIHDTATLAGGFNPTGTITFTLSGPGDTFCAGPSLFTSTVIVNGNGVYQSGSFTPTVSGDYKWRATYSGDTNNLGEGPTQCLDPNETVTVVVAPTPVGITTTASPSIVLGGQLTDTAAITGGTTPTGTVAFALYGPDDAACAGAPAFTSTRPVTGAGSYTSGPFTPVAAGTYRWRASYSGDATNAPAGPTACGDPAETVTVTVPSVSLTTNASGPVAVGGTVTDTATLAGGASPTGTITFRLYGPNDATCGLAPPFTSTKTVSGNGSYTSDPFTPVQPGTYRWRAAYSGDANNGPATTACADPAETVTVSRVVATLVTNASTAVPVGGVIHDTATISGAMSPTGTITFTLYGPNDAACAGPPPFTSTRTVTGNGNYTSADFTTTAAGTYRWRASYSGDANNAAIGPTACTDPAETVVVGAAAPTITTAASGSVPLGGQVTDTATLTGGTAPTGTITFNLYRPDDATCTSAPVFTATTPVSGNGSYTSPPFTPTVPGTYRWRASYSGDATNAAAGPTACADPAEAVVVTAAGVSLTTVASPSVPVGGVVRDTATLAGGTRPTGTITFTLYGPGDTACSGAAVFTSTVPVSGNGIYTSADFTANGAGTYRWRAAYSGDAANAAAGPTACADPAESVVVTPRVTALTTTASPSVGVGGQITDTAVLTGGISPRGGITFSLYGPTDATCAATPLLTSTVAVSGNGSYTSAPFSPTAAGTYRWRAVYTGDADNAGAGPTPCADPAEAVVVTPAAATVTVTTSAVPATRPEPGGPFTYTVVVTNPGSVAVTLTSLTDDTYGNLAGRGTCAVGVAIAAAGGTASCSFTADFTGNAGATLTDTVTATVTPAVGPSVSATASATVRITDVAPTISVRKTAGPPSRPAPGGVFSFGVAVTNTSIEPVTITTITDDVYGNLDGKGTCRRNVLIAAGATSTCSFEGTFTGTPGQAQTDTVTVTAIDDDGTSVSASDHATVTIISAAPSIAVAERVAQPSLPEPGGTFQGQVSVTNTGSDPVKLTSLVDDDLNGKGTCVTPQVIVPNGSYSCTFPLVFTGNAGATRTDTVVATAVDALGRTAQGSDSVTLAITDVPPAVVAFLTPDTPTVAAPGGEVGFSVRVVNPGFEPVTIRSLADDLAGDLAGRGTCAAGVVVAPSGGAATCRYTGTFTGGAGSFQTRTLTVTVIDDDASTGTATSTATVVLSAGPPAAVAGSGTTPPRPAGGRAVPLARTGAGIVRPLSLAAALVLAGAVLVAWDRRAQRSATPPHRRRRR